MDFKDELIALGKSVEELKPYMATEEATKNALVVPFIKMLGYNVFDPREVRPEFVCDIGIKKDEKVDFALFGENKEIPLILIECKQWEKNLLLHESQLVRYFQASKSKFSLLTNGINYKFYTDLEQPNIMDDTPFFEFNITDIKDNQIEQLKKFHKSNFDVSLIMSSAKELKYLRLFREAIKSEFESPSQEFVKHFLSKIQYKKLRTEERITRHTALLKTSLDNYITERVNNNLRRAMETEEEKEVQPQLEQKLPDGIVAIDGDVITTEEEIEGYKIVKAILGVRVSPDKIIYKDTKNYFAINYEKSTQPICRLYFNSRFYLKNDASTDTTKKQIGLFNEGKFDDKTGGKFHDKYDINSLEDIYKYSQKLLDTIDLYDSGTYYKTTQITNTDIQSED
jgi:hypothetical protein